MQRRTFLAASAGAGWARPLFSAANKKSIFELTYFRLRNSPDSQMARTSELLSEAFLPAAKRAGIGPVGLFSGVIAQHSPFILSLVSFPSLAAMEEAEGKLGEDREFRKAVDAYYAKPGLGYMRMESSLLRGFDSMPQIEVPPVEGRKAPRIFELRTYESNNLSTLRRKMKMFDGGEIGIFRRLGMRPVFFGETIVGPNMPNLTYMLSFDNLAAREEKWRAFGSDSEWKKLRAQPGLADAEIVSNISNSILRPLPASPIR
jgi:hypothetical protein